MTQETLSIINRNGQNWVRVCALGEDFLIGIHDLEIDGKTSGFDKPTIQKALKEQGYAELTKKQAHIVCALMGEINTKMEEAGGEPFACDWYAAAEYGGGSSWSFNGTRGALTYGSRCHSHFRCRPALASSFSN